MSFKAIREQERAVAVLKGYISEGKIGGGYLFAGPEGVGKKMAAMELAKALNCDMDGQGPCDACPSCKKISDGRHPDVHLIEAQESEIKIDNIRQLQKQMSLRPFEGKAKVFIIDNAHKLNAEASNALLKALEEPPKNSLLVLITDKPSLLFKTVVSRCKTVKFSALNRDALKKILKEDHGLDGERAHFLAYFSEGQLGRALKLKDNDILRQKNAIIDKFSLSRKPDLESVQLKEKEDMRWWLNILASWFRDIYLVKIGAPLSEVINSDRKEALHGAAGRFSFPELDGALGCISDSLRYLDQNINTRLLLYNLGAQLWKE